MASFTLLAAHDRVYARNVDQKVIDLGALSQQDGAWCYLLDGNKQSGSGLFTVEEALREIASHLRFLWLDGQFTAVADAREAPGFDIADARGLEITLDELQPGEPIQDATV